MKTKSISFMLLGAMTLGAMTGCTKDKPEAELTGSIAVNLRTDISTLKVANDYWETGDKAGLYMKKAGQALAAPGAVYGNAGNVQMSIEGGTLFSTPQVMYPETGSVDFVAYHPYTASVDAAYTIPVSVAGQANGLPKEVLYSKNITDQAPTESVVTLKFAYSLAKLVVTATAGANVTFSAADFSGMTATVEGMFTQAKLQLADGTFTDKAAKQPITLHKTGSDAASATFEALILPATVTAGEIAFVFSAGGKVFRSEPGVNFESSVAYTLKFELEGGETQQPAANLINTIIIPRTETTHHFTATEGTPITNSVLSGYVQKGPYINGSSITITPLDKNLNQTGTVFSTQIIDNAGNFEQSNNKFSSNLVDLKADGYYFNEVKGETSNGSLTLYALTDITDVNSVNVNILTHLERQRIIYLVQNNKLSFSDAKKQARSEVLNIFKFTLPNNVATESLNITADALLLAVSVIVQGQLSTGDMSELLANISSNIRADGKLDNQVLGSQLMNNVAFLDLDKVISNMQKKYSALGITINVSSSELKGYVQQFKDNCGFVQTLGITYPETGKYGTNILAEGFVNAVAQENGRPKDYSMRAELPAGNTSLKIILKTTSDPYWGVYYPFSLENWSVSVFDFNTKIQTWTVYESEKPADVTVNLDFSCIIEYYENGATTPTKVKEVKVDRSMIR
jgi:hypothetical protein